jgi:hypothetical protein
VYKGSDQGTREERGEVRKDWKTWLGHQVPMVPGMCHLVAVYAKCCRLTPWELTVGAMLLWVVKTYIQILQRKGLGHTQIIIYTLSWAK